MSSDGLSRRALARTTLAATAALTSASAESAGEPGLDPVAWTLEQYKSAPLRLTFRSTTPAEVAAWQTELRAKLVELMGGFPSRTPLRERRFNRRSFAGYSREQFTFESRPGLLVTGYLLLPARARRPCPAVICVPGHGAGVDDIVAIDLEGRDRSGKPGYEHDFAIQAVERGLAAVAIEPMAFGHRRDALTKRHGPKASACQPAAGSALLLGQTMLGWRVWDVMRTLDWIETQPELDKSHVGCMGISGGGTCTLFSAALDTRIQAAFVSGYLNTFRDSIMSVSHCIDNYIPGILNWAENYDVAGCIAPRPFFSEGGNRDPIFPMHATVESFRRVQHVYRVCGFPDRARQQIFDGQHEFNGSAGLPFLAQALRA